MPQRGKGGISGQTTLTFHLTGDKELYNKLSVLDRDVQRKIAGPANNAGLGAILKALRAAAPNKRFRRALGKSNRVSRTSHVQTGKVGLNVGKKGDKQFPQGHLLVLGTENRYTGVRSRRTRKRTTLQELTGFVRAYRGRIKPNDWIKPAAQGAMSLAAAVVTSEVWKRLREYFRVR